MRILEDTTELRLPSDCTATAVAIGKFDGVHLGHQRILAQILAQRERGLTPCVFTFEPDPASFFAGRELPRLTDREEKRRILSSLGVELLVEYPMNAQTAATPPEEFVRRVLRTQLRCDYVAAGSDLTFGDGGRGNVELLERLAAELSMDVRIVEKLTWHGEIISSSLIRKKLEEGDLHAVQEMTGRSLARE